MTTITPHPAKYSDPIIEEVEKYLNRTRFKGFILDPNAGPGGVHALATKKRHTIGVEIEPEWASMHKWTICGDCLDLAKLGFIPESIDAIFVSPCMEIHEKILTSDLEWVECGTIEVGQEVMSFDEFPQFTKSNGQPARRRWGMAKVVRSERKKVECVEVELENGEKVITTLDHPWLANKYAHKSVAANWTASKDLVPGSSFVYKQFNVWESRDSFDAGWLSGMFDGEGSLSLGVHGAPKLVITQVLGSVTDKAFDLMNEFGYSPNSIVRKDIPTGYKPINNLYVTGGMSMIAQALGELRPVRLLEKWKNLDLSSRSVKPEKVKVISVTPVGVKEIQEIETSSGTYYGAGYMMHNCYGNRMADNFLAQDSSKRHTYRAYLGREPTAGSSAVMQWGEKYRDFYREAWIESLKFLKKNGLFILNVSDHIRGGKVVPVTDWHKYTLESLGIKWTKEIPVYTRRQRHGENREARVDNEWILIGKKRN